MLGFVGPLRTAWLVAGMTLAVGCGELESEVGRNLVYHWDPQATELCGGTVEFLDRFAELQIARLHLPSERAPVIEYFWTADPHLADNACLHADVASCTMYSHSTYSGWPTIVVATRAAHTHEMVHATVEGRTEGLPNFIGEGLALRSESAMVDVDTLVPGGKLEIDEALLRSKLDGGPLEPGDYAAAGHWWTTLEVEYGGDAMAEILARIRWKSSSVEVEHVLEDVLGISLAESAELATARPIVGLDDAACAMDLPTFVWAGESLVLERNEASCSDADIINVAGSEVVWLATFEVPADEYRIRVEGGSGFFEFTPCNGDPHVTWHTFRLDPPVFGPIVGTGPLKGRYLFGLRGTIDSEGNVDLPRATIERD
jgi:hypothetical protein